MLYFIALNRSSCTICKLVDKNHFYRPRSFSISHQSSPLYLCTFSQLLSNIFRYLLPLVFLPFSECLNLFHLLFQYIRQLDVKVPDVLDFCSNTAKLIILHFTKIRTIVSVFSTLVDWMDLRAFNCSNDALKVLEKQHTFKIRDNSSTISIFCGTERGSRSKQTCLATCVSSYSCPRTHALTMRLSTS